MRNGGPRDFTRRYPDHDPAVVAEIVMGPHHLDTDHQWHRVERGEVGRTVHAAWQGDVEVAGLLRRGVIAADVQRGAEAVGLTPQERVGAVALVRVGVEDERAQAGAFGAQDGAGDGHVVEHAEPQPAVGEGMVRAAAEIGGDADLERGAEREDGPVRLAPGTVEQGRVVRQSEAVAIEGGEAAIADRRQVGGVVDEREQLPRRGLRRQEHGVRELGLQQGPAPRKLVHRERMLRRQGVVVERVMEAAEAHAGSPKSRANPRCQTRPREGVLVAQGRARPFK